MSTKKPDTPVEPKPFKLADYDDIIEREAKKFDLTTERALAIAEHVDEQREAAVIITQTRKESELREVFEEIYDNEIARRQVCPIDDCGERLTGIKQALVHMRTHLLFESDWRTIRAVAHDITNQLFPAVEQEMTAAYTAEERAVLVKRIEQRRLQQIEGVPDKNVD